MSLSIAFKYLFYKYSIFRHSQYECFKFVYIIIVTVLLDSGFFKSTPLRLVFVSSLQIFINHNDDEECRWSYEALPPVPILI